MEYDILHTLHFDPNRKCMSIIVRQKGCSEILLYSKGADSTIYRNLRPILDTSVFRESGFEDQDSLSLPSASQGSRDSGGPGGGIRDDVDDVSEVGKGVMDVTLLRDRTQTYLDDYAKLGLRTLCMAKRVSGALGGGEGEGREGGGGERGREGGEGGRGGRGGEGGR